MTKAAEMGRVSAKGGFHFLWGLVVSSVISAVGAIFIARLLGADSYGLYSVALVAPNLIATFRDWGVSTALVKYSAEYNNENNFDKVRSIFVSGLFFELTLGVLLSLLSFALAGTLAHIFARPTIVPLIQISSFVILTSALVNTATAAFTGMEIMHLNSIMLIIQSILKTALIIALVLFGLGALGAVEGYTISFLLAGLTGAILMWTVYRNLKKTVNAKLNVLATTKIMLKYGLPLSIGQMIGGFSSVFYSYILAIFVTNNIPIGNYNVALNFIVLINFFATPITTMLFPAFSKLNAEKDKEALKNVFQYSVKYSSLIVLPISGLIIALAQPAVGTLYADKYTLAPLFLALSALHFFTTAAGSLSINGLINGQGYTKFGMKLSIVTSAAGLPLSLVLIPQFGVIGLIITIMSSEWPSILMGLLFIKNNMGISVDWISSLKILFTSSTTAVLTYAIVTQLPFSAIIQLILGAISFIFIYIFVALLTRTITKEDFSNLREIASGLGPLSKPLIWTMNLLEKFLGKTNKENDQAQELTYTEES
jgi:O-antigen/teichoic acid export membrane protein